MTDKQNKMILDWMRKIHQLEYAHRFQSIHYVNLDKRMGITAFVITTIVAFSYRFPGLEAEQFSKLPFFLKHAFFVPLASAVAAILTGLLTFHKPSEKSETHKKTGSNYEKLRHKIELILVTNLTQKELLEKLNTIREEWENLDSINVKNKYFKRGKEKVKQFNKYPEELGFLENINESTEKESCWKKLCIWFLNIFRKKSQLDKQK